MIRYRNGAYEVVVYVGRDAVTGREKSVSRTVRMPEGKRTPKRVLDVETALRSKANRGDFGTPDLTVKDMLDRWLEHAKPDLSVMTVHSYEAAIRLYLAPLHKVKLAKLTTAHIDRAYDGLRAKGRKPATIRQAHAILHRACAQAMRWGWLYANPASLADLPTVRRPEIRPPTRTDIATLLDGCDRDLADLIRLGYGTGMRRGELCGLRFSDCHDDELEVVRAVAQYRQELIVKTPKTGKGRTVAVAPWVATLIRARWVRAAERALRFGLALSDGFVLSDAIDAAEPLHPSFASDRFRARAEKVGVKCRLHDLRHAYATEALANGGDPKAVAAQLGHASTAMTLDVYGHPTQDGQRRVAEILAAI